MQDRSIPQASRTLTAVAAAAAALILLALPAAYFAFGYRYIRATLNTEVEINGRLFSQIISANPELWTFEQARLQTLLERRPGDHTLEVRRIVGGDGAVIAEHADAVEQPWTVAHAALYDSGRTVAELQITRSLRPLLLGSAASALLGGLLAFAVFAAVRTLPLRALQRAVNELLAERENAFRLQQERDRADTEARLKTEFLARMSHEIRTPMNGVLGMTELLLSSPLNERQRKFTETAHRSGRALLRIIDDILDFSRIESGKLELERATFSPQELAEDLVQMLAQRASNKGLDLGVLIDADVPERISGDPGRTRQVLANLIGNAIKFTERGEVRVILAMEKASEPGARIRFEVRDTGIGIRPDALGRLFDPFVQADSSISRRFGGTGLGLSISRQLARAMGGELTATSQEGVGSSFFFTLPASDATPPVAAALERAPRVALIDDRSLAAAAVADALRRLGAAPDVFRSETQAFDALRAAALADSPYGIVLVGPDLTDEQRLLLRSGIESACMGAQPQIIRLCRPAPGESAQLSVETRPDRLPLPATTAELRALLLRHSAESGSAVTAAPQSGTAAGGLRGRRVLLVEDNAVNQLVASAMLEALGMHTETAADGAQAIALLERKRYDVVLMDCHMPSMDGYEATRRLRAKESTAGGRQIVIALTANAFAEDRDRCIDAGMDDFLAKPFTSDSLKDTLRRWMGHG